MKYLVKIIIVLFCFGSLSLYAQDAPLRFDHLTVEDGISQSTVYGIAKDKYGFMWFGTWSGLCKYDGYKITTYRTRSNNVRSISNNRIREIIKDWKDDLWISFFDTLAICKYNYDTDDFTRFMPGNAPKEVFHRFRENAKLTSLLSQNTAYRWSVKKWQYYSGKQQLIQKNRLTGAEIIYHNDPMDRWSLNDNYINSLYLDNMDIIWVGSLSGGINKADIHAKPFQTYSHSKLTNQSIIDNYVRAIYEDSNGDLWIGTNDKGITIFNREQKTFKHLQHAGENSLISDEVRRIYKDSHGFF